MALTKKGLSDILAGLQESNKNYAASYKDEEKYLTGGQYKPSDPKKDEEQKKKNSLKDKAQSIAGMVGKAVFGSTGKMINQGLAEAQQVGYTARMLTAQATHNNEAWANANKASQDAYKQQSDQHGGLFDAGTITSGEESRKGDLKTGARKIGANTVGVATEILPFAKGLRAGKAAVEGGEGLAKTLLKEGAIGATYGAVGSAGKQALEGKFDAKKIAEDAAMGGGLGAVGAALGRWTSHLIPEKGAPGADAPKETDVITNHGRLLGTGADYKFKRLQEVEAELDKYRGGTTDLTTHTENGKTMDNLGTTPTTTTNPRLNKQGTPDKRTGEYKKQGIVTPSDTTATTKSPAEIRALMKERNQLEHELNGLDSAHPLDSADHIPLNTKEPHHAEMVDNELQAIQDTVGQHIETPTGKVNALTDYFRTPTAVLKKIGLDNTAKTVEASFENYRKDLTSQQAVIKHWSDRVGGSEESSRNIFQWLDGNKDVTLSPEEAKVATEIKGYMSSWADRLGLPKDKRVSDYITHLFEPDLKGKNKSLDVNLQQLLDKKGSSKVYNPFTENHRTDAKGYKQDVFAALDAYVKRGTRQVNMTPALKATAGAAAKSVDERTAKYLLKYNRAIQNKPEEIDNFLNDAVKGATFGLAGDRGFTNASRAWRNTVYRATLGLNVGSAVRNLTQATNTVAELGVRNTVVGYTQFVKNFMRRDGLEELNRHGVLDDKIFEQDKQMNAIKTSLDKIDKGLWFMFDMAEKINRGSAYFAAKNMALKRGMVGDAAEEFAAKKVAKTQFKFNDIETPLAFRSQAAKTALQFQSFGIKQTELLAGWAKDAARGDKEAMGKIIRYIASNVAMVSAIGGVTGFKLKDMIPSLFQMQGISSPLITGYDIGKEAVTGKDKYGNDFTTTDANGNKVRDNGKLAKDIFQKAAPLVVPGGTQAKKTIEGLNTTTKGASITNNGQVRYLSPTDRGSQVQGAIFGQSSMKENSDFYDNGGQSLSKKQSETVMGVPPEQRASYYDFFKTLQGTDSKKNVGNKVKSAVDAGDFEKAKRLAGEHNTMVQQEMEKLNKETGGLPHDVQDYIRGTYMVDYSYYISRKK